MVRHGGLGHRAAHATPAGTEDCMKFEDRLFSVEETAERLGVSKYTISDWIKAGRLKGTKIGKFWRVKESDLQAFIDNPPPLQPGKRARKRTAAAE
jgi:excisionase family DNA binding protein